MSIGVDIVQVWKSTNEEDEQNPFGGPTPINPQQDAIESAGQYFQDENNRDKTVYEFRDGKHLKFKDQHEETSLSDMTLKSSILENNGSIVYIDDGEKLTLDLPSA